MRLLLILFFTSTSLFAQDTDLIGVWTNGLEDGINGCEYTKDGVFRLFNLDKPNEKILKINIMYKTIQENGVNYIEYLIYKDGELVKKDKDKYKIEDDKLYLPTTMTDGDGNVTVYDFKSIYTRLSN